jgi:hypothetical protein
MTLKEKFKQWLDTEPRYQIREVQLEIIADEFAVGFAEWLIEKEREHPNRIIRGIQLLEIYKNEKGLQNGNY